MRNVVGSHKKENVIHTKSRRYGKSKGTSPKVYKKGERETEEEESVDQVVKELEKRILPKSEKQEPKKEEPSVQINPNLLRALSDNWTARVAHDARNAVVKIISSVVHFDWEQPYRRAEFAEAIGSGFFVTKDGLIATNAHVVEEAVKVWITVPSEGERRYNAEVIGVCFDADLAILRAKDAPVERFLELGDSDSVIYGQEVLTLGYPLGMESLKLTVGIISGRQEGYFQTDAPLNPGNSGGPMLNEEGKVIGINVAIVEKSQNVGFAIPVHHLGMLFEPLKNRPIWSRVIHKPLLGAELSNCSEDILEFKDCPQETGTYVSKSFPGFPLYNAGVREGDILHSFNGFQLDNFGDAKVPWSPYAKENIETLVSLMDQNSKPEIEWTHDGKKKKAQLNFEDPNNPGYPILPSIREYYPPFEKIDYEVIGGLIVMNLSLNHLAVMHEEAPSESVLRFLTPIATSFSERMEPQLIISSILSGSLVAKQDVFEPGSILSEVNGIKVKTLAEFREAILKPVTKNGQQYITLLSKQNELAVMSLKEVLKEEFELSQIYLFNVSKVVFQILRQNKDLMEQVVGSDTGLRAQVKAAVHSMKKEEEVQRKTQSTEKQ